MQQVSCLVALTGDVLNKIYLEQITPPELLLLRQIHGENAVTEIRVIASVKLARDGMLAERERLLYKYPRYHDLVIGIWRDSGGKFPDNVMKLGLDSSLFATTRDLPKATDLPADLPDDEAEPEEESQGKKRTSIAM